MRPELLAPAGSFACAEAAFIGGADAVYAGIGKFNLRAHSPNFSVDEFGELLKLAGVGGKRVYGALNIMPSDDLMAPIAETIGRLVDAGYLPDAFIISDPGVLSLITEICPGVPIHLSTQSGCFNSAAMKFWRKQGVSRIILPRELCIDQIRRLSRQGAAETEVFVHGAMCVSISGRCLLGAYYGGRHPNLGDCQQPCRLRYRIAPIGVGRESGHGKFGMDKDQCQSDGFDVEEFSDCENGSWNPNGGAYLLNSKDLCAVGIIPKLIESGVSSLKIEGRNKTAYYVASTVKVYRDAIDTYTASPDNYKVKDWWREELESIDHRPYTTGFYDGAPIKQEVFASKARAGYRLVGVVKAVVGGRPVVDVKNVFSVSTLVAAESASTVSTSINVLPVKGSRPPFNLTVGALLEFDGAGGESIGTINVQRAMPNRLVILDGCSERLSVGDMLRITHQSPRPSCQAAAPI